MGEANQLMIVTMNRKPMAFGGKYLGWLRESNDILDSATDLRHRFEQDGYLLIRDLQPVDLVQSARQHLITELLNRGQIDTNFPLLDGVAKTDQRGGFFGGQKEMTRGPEFLNMVESKQIMDFCDHFFGTQSMTYDYKWLRVVAPKGFTGAHYDIVYMGRGTTNVLTCWTPIGDIPLELGPLAILVGSHRFEIIKGTYGQMDVDRDHVTGWFSNDPFELIDKYGGQWQTANFRQGDVLIFGMFTMHASLDNTTNRFRLTTDTRYQPANEPVDDRWIGDNPTGHYAWRKGKTVSMDQARQQWNV